ncbi:hypothetical protein [Spiroplasma tabanidicola]|uniref:Carbamoyl phosphate synthase ATP-binding domain-containing protein n=1 Tax=Spiroplasma tabanidicola TaxID=324079 RepID=A0A6I6CD84_9MOLU|nr:hypothetical protein [Spiroplasma tabanidicola]QGS52092.1 hypothetical protein STABA_v1c07360 [Spiroplasma tabanidicola]
MEIEFDFFKKLSGRGNFYDFNSQLNYFDYFGITPDDIKLMINIMSKNENRMADFFYELEKEIYKKIQFYSTHLRDSHLGFIAVGEEKLKESGRAFVCSMLYLSARLLAQEYMLLSTVNKTKYNVDLRVHKFGNEKFSYKIYLQSLRVFYESLSAWSFAIMGQDFEYLIYFTKMDEFVDTKIYDLKAYKDLFMLIWMQSYVKQAKELREYILELEPDNLSSIKVAYNALKPLNFDSIFKLDDDDLEIKRKEFIFDYNIWIDDSLKRSIRANREDIYSKVSYSESLNLNEYLEILETLIFSFRYYNVYDYEGYVTNLYGTIFKHFHNRLSGEWVVSLIKNITYSRQRDEPFKKNVLEDFYQEGIYKKPLLAFFDNNKKSNLVGFPEIIWMSFHAHKEWMLFDASILTNFNKLMNSRLREMLKDSLVSLHKRFSIIKNIEPEKIPFFQQKANINRGSVDEVFVDAIAYEENIKKCFFFVNHFFPEAPQMWHIYKCGLITYKGLDNIIKKVITPRFNIIFKDYKKISKQLKLPKDCQFSMVLLVNDILEVNPRIDLDNGIKLYIVAFPAIEHFLTNFIYKK